MSLEEIKTIFDLFINYGVGSIVTGFVVFLLFKFFLPGYLSEKGKNIATKEDISEITDKVESIRIGYAELIEQTKTENQLKISAVEREKILKKEVYMEAVESIVKAQSIIGKIADMNLAEDQLGKEFSAESGKIAKIQLVGEEETVRLIINFMGELGAAFLELILDRATLTHRKIDIDISTNMRDRYQSEVDRYIAVMKNMNLQGISDSAPWEVVNNSLKFESEQRDKHNEELSKLWDAQNKDQLALSRKCTDKYFEIANLLPNLVISVRKELDLPINAEEYVKINRDSLQKGITILKQFYTNLENIGA